MEKGNINNSKIMDGVIKVTGYILVDEDGLYTGETRRRGARAVWNRACDVAMSYINQKCFSKEKYRRLKAEGKLKILPVKLRVNVGKDTGV